MALESGESRLPVSLGASFHLFWVGSSISLRRCISPTVSAHVGVNAQTGGCCHQSFPRRSAKGETFQYSKS